MSYTLYIYKRDRRCRSGERLYATETVPSVDNDSMSQRIQELDRKFHADGGWRWSWTPKMKTVKNLMTGKLVEIPYDTPRVCDPSTESYWSK